MLSKLNESLVRKPRVLPPSEPKINPIIQAAFLVALDGKK